MIPVEIEPGGCPGGLVFRLYDGHEQVVIEQALSIDDIDTVDAHAEAAARTATETDGWVLAVYDGDSGLLMVMTMRVEV